MMPVHIPPIRIAASDFRLLKQIAARAIEDRHPVSRFLFSELERAVIHEDTSPLHCVRLDDWVTFRADNGQPLESRVLVLPEKFRAGRFHVSVLSPLGAALLGLPPGASMPYAGIDGARHLATVDSLSPPEGIISLQQHRARKFTSHRDGDNPDRPGPTAA